MSVRILTKVWESDLSKTDMLVMLALADCADDDGVLFPKTTYLAWKTGLTRQTVAATLTKFRDAGYISGTPSQGEESTRYQIAVHNLPEKSPWTRFKVRMSGHSGRETLSNPPTGCSDPVKTAEVPCQNGKVPCQIHEGTLSKRRNRNKEEPSVEPSTEPSVEPSETSALFPEGLVVKNSKPEIPGWVPADLWADFVEMRKKLKAPMTDRAMELAVKELGKLQVQGYSPTEVLEQSIMRGWKGLFPVKDGNNGSGQNGVTRQQQRNREVLARYS